MAWTADVRGHGRGWRCWSGTVETTWCLAGPRPRWDSTSSIASTRKSQLPNASRTRSQRATASRRRVRASVRWPTKRPPATSMPSRCADVRTRRARRGRSSSSGTDRTASHSAFAASGCGKQPAPPSRRPNPEVRSPTACKASANGSTKAAGTSAAKAQVTCQDASLAQRRSGSTSRRGSTKELSCATICGSSRSATNMRDPTRLHCAPSRKRFSRPDQHFRTPDYPNKTVGIA